MQCKGRKCWCSNSGAAESAKGTQQSTYGWAELPFHPREPHWVLRDVSSSSHRPGTDCICVCECEIRFPHLRTNSSLPPVFLIVFKELSQHRAQPRSGSETGNILGYVHWRRRNKRVLKICVKKDTNAAKIVPSICTQQTVKWEYCSPCTLAKGTAPAHCSVLELDSVIPGGPFQLRIFHNSTISV